MNHLFQRWVHLCALCLALPVSLVGSVSAADTLNWRTNQNLVSADIKSGQLSWLLEQIVSATSWQVYVEPDLLHTVSAKFQDLAPGDALRLLLGDLSFALIPETKANPKLFVFRKTLGEATQRVRPARGPEPEPGDKEMRRRPRRQPPTGREEGS